MVFENTHYFRWKFLSADQPDLHARALDLLERSGSHKAVLTTREAAEYAGVKPATVLDWIRRGLAATDRGGSAGYAVRKSELDDWIAGGGPP